MAYSFSNKNGTTYINMDGQEYPLFNRWDNTDPMSENSTGGYFGVEGDTGYYASDVDNAILGRFGLYQPTKIDSIQGWLERNKQDMASQDKSNAIAAALSLAAIGGVAAPAFMGGTAATSGGMSQAVELVKAGFPYTEAAQLTGVSEEALFTALDTGAIGATGAAASGGLGMADGLAMENAAGLNSFEDAAALAGGEAGSSSLMPFLKDVLTSKGLGAVISLLSGSGLGTAAINGIMNNLLKNSAQDNMNEVWDQVTNGITNANQLRDLAPTAKSLLGDTSFLNSAKSSMAGLQDMFNNPNNYAGYDTATTANNAAANFINDPMSDPGVMAALNIGAENTARKSSSGRGLNSGSFMAEQNAANLANLANLRQQTLGAYGTTANAGMNQFNGLADVGKNNVVSAIAGANANTQQGSAAANAANAHLNALGTAAQSFINPMIQMKSNTDPTTNNLRGIVSGLGNVDWSGLVGGIGNLFSGSTT